ncbi:ChbG/HpnK family deacetylase [Archangium violaceum]|uniref:carbohydrate deacetylase n=1 Tax=Archangium violaceum TaxID=83451 RepID=UPI00194F6129|nr:ChbG/HpnK family deacetylase [Archangium violaceum]QRN99101.1 ChbG/HpnK family deacetylase [Archangium violaceum]
MSARALIINADDLGYDPAITRGILRSMHEGIVSSATFMVNTPYADTAADEARGLSIGLHLNLARGLPVWAAFPSEFLQLGAFSEALVQHLPPDVVEAETLAQLERLDLLLGQPATHVDVHKHLHQHPGVFEGLVRAARVARLPVRSIHANMRRALRAHGVATNDHLLGDTGAEAYWTLERLEQQLDTLPEQGVIELMCHPGYTPEAVKSGYAHQREVELATFLHPRAHMALARLGLKPTSFRVLTGAKNTGV